MPDQPPSDAADHAEQFAHRWADRLDEYCALRMDELDIPDDRNGTPDYEGNGQWRAFVPRDRSGGNITSGVVLNSGCLNPELLNGMKCGNAWAAARLRDRIDAVIAHEWEENRIGSHEAALKAAPDTELPITDGARRILLAMGAQITGSN